MISAMRSTAWGFSILARNAGAAARDLARLGQILGALDEGERDPVHMRVERRVQILAVLLRQRADGNGGVGNRNALAVGELAADLDAGRGARRVALGHDELDLAVIKQKPVAGFQRGQDFRVGKAHALVRAGRILAVEREGGAFLEDDGLVREGADAQLGALKVGQNADRPFDPPLPRRGIRSTSVFSNAWSVWLMLYAKDVGTGLEELLDQSLDRKKTGPRVARILTRRLRFIVRQFPVERVSVN